MIAVNAIFWILRHCQQTIKLESGLGILDLVVSWGLQWGQSHCVFWVNHLNSSYSEYGDHRAGWYTDVYFLEEHLSFCFILPCYSWLYPPILQVMVVVLRQMPTEIESWCHSSCLSKELFVNITLIFQWISGMGIDMQLTFGLQKTSFSNAFNPMGL